MTEADPQEQGGVGIIGGGILGLCLAHELTKRGRRVTVFEAEARLGGLASPFLLDDGTAVDRFYHTILSSDSHLRGLCAEIGLADRLHFARTRTGFFHDGHVYPMNGLADFLRFPPLSWLDRLRLGLNILAAQFTRDWRRLERIRMTDWLARWSGRRVVERLWAPLLRAKFDGAYEDVPATWMWSRLTRMRTARRGMGQAEEAGYLRGGYHALLKALAARVESGGGRVLLGQSIQEIVPENGRIRLRLTDRHEVFDRVVATPPTPVFARLLPSSAPDDYRRRLAEQPYLGVLCVLLVLDRPLTGYWTLNITDPGVPFTGVVETTSYIPSADVGGWHLVYLPKYLVPNSRYASLSDEEVRTEWLGHAFRMFPNLRLEQIRQVAIHRARYVEPLHPMSRAPLPPLDVRTPVPGLYLATTARIYPELSNGESVSRHADRVADLLAGRWV